MITLFVIGQSKKLENNSIFKVAYPDAKQNYSRSDELLRNNGSDRTLVQNIFFYKISNTEKAIAILATYDYSSGSGESASCHACKPSLDIITFELKNNSWIKT